MSVETQSGKLRLDLSRYELSRDGQPVKLERQPMELLIFLVQRKGQLVTRNDIVEKLWGRDVFVDVDRSVNAAVFKIRAALKDDPAEPKCLETIIGKGYRFIGEVEIIPTPAGQQAAVVQQGPPSVAHLGSLRAVTISILAALAVLALLYVSNVARELNVDAVVEGSILRSGDRIRISAQLIQAPQDKQIWAESYDRDIRDVLALQSDVAGAIVEQIKAKITPAEAVRLSTARQVDPQVYQLYVQGLYYSDKGSEQSARESREYFQKVIEKDPGYALAWAGLAQAYNRVGDYARAKESARKAIALDQTIGEGHATLAFATWQNDWNWSIAAEEFKRAIELSPNNSLAHHGYAAYLSALRRHDEACDEMQRSLELDPLSPLANANLGSIYWSSHDFDRAIQQLKKALEIDPNFPDAHLYLGMVYESLGSYDQALAEFEKYRALGNPPEAEAEIAHLFALQGRRAEALELLNGLKARHKAGEMPSYDIALVYVGLGDKDHAFQWLRNSYAEHSDNLMEINDDLRFEALRPDPRFRDLLRSVNYPE